jgi:hypothetical protein
VAPPPSGAAPTPAGGRRLRLLPVLAAAAILLGAGLGAAIVWFAGWRGGVRYADIPVAELPLPPIAVAPPAVPAPVPQAKGEASDGERGRARAEPPPALEARDEAPSPTAAVDAAPHLPKENGVPTPRRCREKASAGGPGARDVAAPGSVAHHTLPAVAIGGPPAEPDPALLERRGAVALPVVAPDGRKARRVYARAARAAGTARGWRCS